MNEFNPNCGKCGMLNSRGFCSLTACRYPSNVIVVEPKVIRGMMVNPQIEKTTTNADRIRSMGNDGLAAWYCHDRDCRGCEFGASDGCHILDWLKEPVEVQDG